MAEPGKSPRDDSTVPPMPQPGGIAARARAAAGAPYLKDLNPEQRLAVETLDGPVLVLAGAGTGKTRVLTTRIAHILATGRARPSEILAVTFTNKAAREMKLRVGTMVGQIVEGMPWLGTFHSIGVKILRRHAELVGLKPDFTILDVDDQIRLIKQLLEAENIDEKRWPARVMAMLMDGWKNRGLTPEQVPGGEAAVFANGMEGAEPRHALHHAADQLSDALLHFARRLVGEGDGEDLRGPRPAQAQNMGYARGEHARLAGAGAGQHQKRSVERLDRLTLLGVQRIEIVAWPPPHGSLGRGKLPLLGWRQGGGRGANLCHRIQNYTIGRYRQKKSGGVHGLQFPISSALARISISGIENKPAHRECIRALTVSKVWA